MAELKFGDVVRQHNIPHTGRLVYLAPHEKHAHLFYGLVIVKSDMGGWGYAEIGYMASQTTKDWEKDEEWPS